MYAVRAVTDSGAHRFIRDHEKLRMTRRRNRATLYVLRSDAELAAQHAARLVVGVVSTAVCSTTCERNARWHELVRFPGPAAPRALAAAS